MSSVELLQRQLVELVSRYARVVDGRLFDQLDQVFAAGGVLDSGRGVRRGIDEISAAMQGLHVYQATDHQITDTEFGLDPTDPDRAWGHVACEAHHISNTEGQLSDRVMFIRYDDQYRATDAGWRIEQRKLNLLDEQTNLI